MILPLPTAEASGGKALAVTDTSIEKRHKDTNRGFMVTCKFRSTTRSRRTN